MRSGVPAMVYAAVIAAACSTESAPDVDGAAQPRERRQPAPTAADAPPATPAAEAATVATESPESSLAAPRSGIAGIVAERAESLRPTGAAMPSPAELARGYGKPFAPTEAELRAPLPTARTLPSGLVYQVLEPGSGTRRATANDRVEVHYAGFKPDGERFETTMDPPPGTPRKFKLDRVIPGWTEGLQLMAEGEIARFWIPEDLAYKGRRGLGGPLVFDIELISVEVLPAPPKAPASVATIPTDATVTASGLGYKVLTPGGGGPHPAETDTVEVHYTGWTTDGKSFDSSVTRGRSAKFPLNRVIPGWTEGLQLMVVGETAVLWIPEALAYKGSPGKPAGMLVFQVELIAIS